MYVGGHTEFYIIYENVKEIAIYTYYILYTYYPD